MDVCHLQWYACRELFNSSKNSKTLESLADSRHCRESFFRRLGDLQLTAELSRSILNTIFPLLSKYDLYTTLLIYTRIKQHVQSVHLLDILNSPHTYTSSILHVCRLARAHLPLFSNVYIIHALRMCYFACGYLPPS